MDTGKLLVQRVEGKLPALTKEEFKKYNILTVHLTIVMNALVFMHKCRHFPNSFPVSIIRLIDLQTVQRNESDAKFHQNFSVKLTTTTTNKL